MSGVLFTVFLALGPGEGTGSSIPEWTVMIYGCGDSSAEDHLMPHLQSMAYASQKGQNANVVLLFDRSPGYSEDDKLLGENFEDTRLFELKEGRWRRVSGGEAFPEITTTSKYEANSGDAHTLRKFIRFGKSQYPAKHYLIMPFGHGESRSFCPDMSSPCADSGETEDPIFTAEVTEVLGAEESVDFAWFDVCTYGGIENAYQFRPGNGRFSANAMIATPPSSAAGPMREIMVRAGIVGNKTTTLPADGAAFGKLAVEVIEGKMRGSLMPGEFARESWGCYDLTVIEQAKQDIDRLAVLLATRADKEDIEAIRGSGDSVPTMNYFKPGNPRAWLVSAHFDLYDLLRRIQETSSLSDEVRSAAKQAMESVDRLMLASFGMENYPGFENGRNGIYIIFPDGDAPWEDRKHWSTFRWFHPDDRRKLLAAFGSYAWCKDGATPGNGKVENWFELLDYWFDTNDPAGGANGYAP